ncbi:protein adenylyltransferase SelO [Niallia nealsonii]|uniref:Protein nucleotidyltransferase YdiU n=1 Tax=Niallia nealsonii TaxID=115979 RepID=A0A2N0Z403_9BACI|nr:YdiU family protein [Niallia nealsonii]PKG24243.1 YdiU family protein [Niallia nealsonii]
MTTSEKKGWNLENSYAELPPLFFSNILPTPVSEPKLVIFNDQLAASIGLDREQLQSEEGAAIFAGNKTPKGAAPLAQAYAGHQFGYFNRLGDGRAILLGEQITPKGKRIDVQLKGPGRTPYSRGGDGRASLGPMLREYIISEAMYALGIPTTRSLAVVTTGESIIREKELPGAILTRVASSHLRVGTFQYAANWGTVDEIRSLADYTITRHYPELKTKENPYLCLLQEVIKQQASLIAKWQLVGFIHGVMNTDNMTISGETIDYGPCAFMDVYDPETVFSSIDREGRYSYSNQPSIGGWNLARFAESLLSLLADDEKKALELAQTEISAYGPIYYANWLNGMRRKLGLFNAETEDEELISNLLKIMEKYRADYTNVFVALTFAEQEDTPMFKSLEFTQWHKLWQERLGRQKESKEERTQLMKNNNPAVIPRNHRVEEALEAAVEQGDYSIMKRLLDALSKPYEHTDKQIEYAQPSKETAPYRTYCGT